MASAVAMMIGVPWSMPWRSQEVFFFIFKTKKNNDAEAERERHDKAVEQ